MDTKTQGAWLLAQSKSLDAVTGAGAAQLENISYAGKIGRLFNLLRRSSDDDATPSINKATVSRICQLNNIDRNARERGLEVLQRAGKIDVANNGAVSVIGATSTAVLETTSEIFSESSPTNEELAVLELSEKVSDKPMSRSDAVQFVADSFRLKEPKASSLIELCKTTAIIDEETDRSRSILFNSNTFRDGQYAKKTLLVLESLSPSEQARLREVQERISLNGALHDLTVQRMLGEAAYRRLVGVGLFDRLEVSNTTEAVGYIVSPNDFQKYGKPFVDDPVDDAKSLIASLTYGQTRRDARDGSITMVAALLRALIAGREIGANGVRAIGEDYRDLERRQVVEVTQRATNRYTMKLLKKDVGEIALTIVRGGAAAQEAVLLDGTPASSFKGPHIARTEVRADIRVRNQVEDRVFLTDALDRLRSGR